MVSQTPSAMNVLSCEFYIFCVRGKIFFVAFLQLLFVIFSAVGHSFRIVYKFGDPVPGKNALHGNDEVGKIGINGLLQHVGIDGQVFMKQRFAALVDDADLN